MSALQPVTFTVRACLARTTPAYRAPIRCRATPGSSRASFLLLLAACALIFPGNCVAADADTGGAKVNRRFVCHGENGISERENTPPPASQADQFLQWELITFRGSAA
jgi:hypothetical protein